METRELQVKAYSKCSLFDRIIPLELYKRRRIHYAILALGLVPYTVSINLHNQEIVPVTLGTSLSPKKATRGAIRILGDIRSTLMPFSISASSTGINFHTITVVGSIDFEMRYVCIYDTAFNNQRKNRTVL